MEERGIGKDGVMEKGAKGQGLEIDSRRERKATQRGKNNGGRTFLSAIKILIERLGEWY